MWRPTALVLTALAIAGCAANSPEPSKSSTIAASNPPRPSTVWTPPSTGGTFTIPTNGTPKPTSSTPPTATATPGRHDDGPCPAPGTKGSGLTNFIVGTKGSDTLRGTAKDETICGLGGNDVITGGGGKDTIFGGPGNHLVVGGPMTDTLYGGDGDDILRGMNAGTGGSYGYDYIYGDSVGPQYDDTGNDVLLGGALSTGEAMYGGPGNDQLVPTNQPILTNYANGGPGNDIIIAQNYRGGSQVDIVDVNGTPDPPSVQLTNACKLSFAEGGDKRLKATGSCDVPWPKRLSGLDKVVPLSASIDSDGKVTGEATIAKQLGKLSVSAWRNMISWQASIATGIDGCICDPLSSTPPKDLRQPWDLGR